MREIVTLSLLASMALMLGACHSSSSGPVTGPTPAPPGNYSATIITNMGNIDIELFPQQAPLAVGNFVGLADGTQPWTNPATGQIEHKPLYNGTIFHRVIPGFMIQGGDPTGTGTGNPGYQFKNEIAPGLTFDRAGRVGMANAGPNTNGCQFFITTGPQPHLNGGYTIFGQVTKGQEVVDAISKVPRNSSDRPLKPVVIEKIEVHKS